MKLMYNREQIRKFKLGAVVEVYSISAPVYSISTPDEGRGVIDVGHVQGFDRNPCGDVIVKVQCSDGVERTYHPYHLDVL